MKLMYRLAFLAFVVSACQVETERHDIRSKKSSLDNVPAQSESEQSVTELIANRVYAALTNDAKVEVSIASDLVESGRVRVRQSSGVSLSESKRTAEVLAVSFIDGAVSAIPTHTQLRRTVEDVVGAILASTFRLVAEEIKKSGDSLASERFSILTLPTSLLSVKSLLSDEQLSNLSKRLQKESGFSGEQTSDAMNWASTQGDKDSVKKTIDEIELITALMTEDWDKSIDKSCEMVGAKGVEAAKSLVKSLNDCGLIGESCKFALKWLKQTLTEDWENSCVGKATRLEGNTCTQAGAVECVEGPGFVRQLYNSYITNPLKGKGFPSSPQCNIIKTAVVGWINTKTVNGTVYPGGICLECSGYGGSLNARDLKWLVYSRDTCGEDQRTVKDPPKECPTMPQVVGSENYATDYCAWGLVFAVNDSKENRVGTNYNTIGFEELRKLGIVPETLPDCGPFLSTQPDLCVLSKLYSSDGSVVQTLDQPVACLYSYSRQRCQMADSRCMCVEDDADSARPTCKTQLEGAPWCMLPPQSSTEP